MTSARRPDETYEQYCERRNIENQEQEAKLTGKVFWDSSKQGTYTRPVDAIAEAKPSEPADPVPEEAEQKTFGPTLGDLQAPVYGEPGGDGLFGPDSIPGSADYTGPWCAERHVEPPKDIKPEGSSTPEQKE